MPIKLPKNLEPILNVGEEQEPALQALADKHKAVLLALVAPYIPERISPSQFASASLGISEEFGIETVISHIKAHSKAKTLFLVIHSPGGAVSSSYKIAKALGKSFDNIKVFVPYVAASGGTIVSLVGKEIVMGKMSHLTPIDPQYGSFPLNALPRAFSRLEDYFSKKEKSEAPFPWVALVEKIDPAELENCLGNIRTVEQYAYEILMITHNMKKEDARKIAFRLAEGFPSHSSLIGIEVVKEIGLNAVKSETFGPDWDVLREWIGNYLLKSDSQHFIRCVIPKQSRKRTNAKIGSAKSPGEKIPDDPSK